MNDFTVLGAVFGLAVGFLVTRRVFRQRRRHISIAEWTQRMRKQGLGLK